MFEGFSRRRVSVNGIGINVVVGGGGPPVLLLHGYPQTHTMWHRVAPRLAKLFTVVCTDLRGYGDSDKPPSDATHEPYSKRTMARDQLELMWQLGHERFALVGHDRGARVARRLALDHPQAVTRLVLLDIVPTAAIYNSLDQTRATAVWRYFFLIQPADLPERLIGGRPRLLPGLDARRVGRRARGARARCASRVQTLLRSRRHPCRLRGLPGRSHDRQRPR
jgi:haloacetate dehalogenase